jgi:hypothetical protein
VPHFPLSVSVQPDFRLRIGARPPSFPLFLQKHGKLSKLCVTLYLTACVAQGNHGHQKVHRDRSSEGRQVFVYPPHSQKRRLTIHVAARIKKSLSKVSSTKYSTKFKIRCSRYLYTLRIDDPEKAEKLKASLPPGGTLLNTS